MSQDSLGGGLANARKPALLQRFRSKEAIAKRTAKEKEDYEKLKTMKKDCLSEIDELREHYYAQHRKQHDN